MTSEIRANTIKNRVGLGTVSYTNTGIVVSGIVTANSFSGPYNGTDIVGTGITLTSTDAGSAAGPELKLFRNSASPADADYLGQLKFAGESDTGVERNYAKITGKILDASNGTEDGILEFAHIKAGSQTITGRWRSDSLQLLNGTSLTVAGTSEFTGAATLGSDLIIPDYIKHLGDTNTMIGFPSNDSFSVTTNNVTRMTFTGNFIDLPDAGTFRFGGSQDLQIYHGSGGASNIVHSNTSQPLIISATGAGSIRFDTNSGSRLLIDSGGRVGLGITNPDAYFSSYNRVVMGRPNDSGSMTIVSAPTFGGYISFADGTSGNQAYRGLIMYGHGGDYMTFNTDSTEKLRITSEGNVIIAESMAVNRPRIVLSAPNDGTNYRHLFGANLQVNSSGTFTTPTANISGGGWEYLPANSLNDHGNLRYLSAPDTNSTSSTPLERLRITSTGLVHTKMTGTAPSWLGDTIATREKFSVFQGANFAEACFNIDVDNANSFLSHNMYYSSGWRIKKTGQPVRHLEIGTNGWRFMTGADGANDAISALTERFRIDSSGNLTVTGSATSMFPDAALNIVSDKNVETGVDDKENYHLVLANPNNDTGEAIGIAFGITDTTTKVGAAIVHERDAAGSQGSLKFFTRPNNAGPPVEGLRIASNGNVSIGNNPTVHADTIFHIEDSGETNVKVEGSTSTLGARISLQNNNTTANSYSQYAFNDAGGQSTSAIQGINTDQTNNYGELAFLTRNAQGTPPQERMRISKDGYVTKPSQPRALVKIYSTTTMGNGKVTNWASPTYNVGGLWDTSNKRFVAPVTGLYLVGGNFRIGAPGKVRVTRFELRAYNTSNVQMAGYGGGTGGGNNYDGGSGGYDHPYVSFTNAIYLQTGQYLELWLGEVGTEHTTYIQTSNEQSAMWCVLLQ